MNTIEKIYTNYDGLLEEFSEEVIQSRYAVFYEEIEEFAKSLGIREKIQISESLLSHAVLDYFTDISRLKHFHQAKHINSLKVISYETTGCCGENRSRSWWRMRHRMRWHF